MSFRNLVARLLAGFVVPHLNCIASCDDRMHAGLNSFVRRSRMRRPGDSSPVSGDSQRNGVARFVQSAEIQLSLFAIGVLRDACYRRSDGLRW